MQDKWTLFKFEQYLEIHKYKISHLHKYTICAAGNDDFVQIGLLLPAAPEMTEASTRTLVLVLHLSTILLVHLCLYSTFTLVPNQLVRLCLTKRQSHLARQIVRRTDRLWINIWMILCKVEQSTLKQNKMLCTVIKQCCEAESICDDKPPSAPLPLSVSSSSPPRFLPSSFTE